MGARQMFTVMITVRKSNKNSLEHWTDTYYSSRGKIPCTYISEYINVKKESKFFPAHAIEACRGNKVIAPCVLNLGTRWR
jgi:hypothetical protein